MPFRALYEHVAGLGHWPIRVETDLCPKIIELTSQDEITFTSVELDPDVSLGHMKQYQRHPAVYALPISVTDIRYHRGLNTCWRRFVCAKELMQIFDSDAERADSDLKFRRLLGELETAPLPGQESPMYNSEFKTQWMALAVLCPVPVRDRLIERFRAGHMTSYEVALELRVPEAVIGAIAGDNYGAFIESLLS